MAGRGNSFPRNYSIGDSSESSFFHNPTPEEKGKEHMYSVDNEVVDDLRRFTREYSYLTQNRISEEILSLVRRFSVGRRP